MEIRWVLRYLLCWPYISCTILWEALFFSLFTQKYVSHRFSTWEHWITFLTYSSVYSFLAGGIYCLNQELIKLYSHLNNFQAKDDKVYVFFNKKIFSMMIYDRLIEMQMVDLNMNHCVLLMTFYATAYNW